MAFTPHNPFSRVRGTNWASNQSRHPISPAIMESVDSLSLISNGNYQQPKEKEIKSHFPIMPDITLASEFMSLELRPDNVVNVQKGFQLFDHRENLKVSSAEEFCSLLGSLTSEPGVFPKAKVVTIVGNTGDGKSHTLNHLFFNGEEVFQTSIEQASCTLGVWAAYSAQSGVICLDTEGLMGSTKPSDAQYRNRLLVKVLAVSDVLIYRTRSDRLHENMYRFLSSASNSFINHLQNCLETIAKKNDLGGSISSLGPSVVIFHETRHTKPLGSSNNQISENLLRKNFQEMDLPVDAFSSIRYIGQQTLHFPTDYSVLSNYLKTELSNTAVRSPRNARLVFNILKALNDRFSGRINVKEELIPDEYFTCPTSCLSCSSRCSLSMGHSAHNEPHHTNAKCRYQHQYENIYYICKNCHSNGKEVRVIPKYSTINDNSWFEVITKYAWSGYVIECPNCGEIYRSRQYWYGNTPPEDTAVRTEIHHIWPGGNGSLTATQNSAQRVIDGVAYFTEAFMSASATPTKALSSWMSDQVAPKYWKPNTDIKKCFICQRDFTFDKKIHHCRMCGEGVCTECSNRKKTVPEKGWDYPVRVCDRCFNPPANDSDMCLVNENEVMPRKVSEAVVTTFSTIGSILNFPKSMIKETARPSYWVPDSEARECCLCLVQFVSCGGTALIHHCRSCGGAVCGGCSTGRKSVPHRGWDTAVRVCDKCFNC